LAIRLKTLGGEHPYVADSYNNIGVVWKNKGEYDKALDFYQKSLEIKLKTLGGEHPSVADSYNNIGLVWDIKGEYDKALDFQQNCLAIRLKTLGGEHPSVADSYNDIGVAWKNKGEYDKALDFYQMCLAIRLKTLGTVHPNVSNSYYKIGICLKIIENYQKAIEAFSNGFKIVRKGVSSYQIAKCNEALGNKIDALEYFILSAEISKDDKDYGIEDESTIESIENALRLSKEIAKENELPEWMKNYSRDLKS